MNEEFPSKKSPTQLGKIYVIVIAAESRELSPRAPPALPLRLP